jgi:hypothetical protein
LVKLSFEGFENEERLMPVAVLDDGSVLSADHARALLRSGFTETATKGSKIADEVIDDAIEEELFSMQGVVDRAEEPRFARASQQAERFIEDQLTVQRARRAQLAERHDAEEQRLVAAVGSEARTEIERVRVRIETEVQEIESIIDRLERRDDPTYRAYRDNIQRRRYLPPRIERLFDVDLILE